MFRWILNWFKKRPDKVWKLLSDESKWCKGAYTRDKDGKILWDINDSHVVQWCLSGAILHVYQENEDDVYVKVMKCLPPLGLVLHRITTEKLQPIKMFSNL